MKDKERIEEVANFVFLVTGALHIFFAGYEVDKSVLMSFILMVMGVLCLCITVEYTKKEIE